MSKISYKVVIVLGSISDLSWAKEIGKVLTRFKIPFDIRVASAHKSPEYAQKLLKEYESKFEKLVFIAIAGRSNALGGFLDANTHFPIINCPPKVDSYAGMDILSSLRMPSGVAPATVLEPDHAAILAAKIFGLVNKQLSSKIKKYHQELVSKIKRDDESLLNKRVRP